MSTKKPDDSWQVVLFVVVALLAFAQCGVECIEGGGIRSEPQECPRP